MTGINNVYNNSELAFASYANLINGDLLPQKTSLIAIGMSQKQAEEFATRYSEVITQFNDTDTSFSATVFKDRIIT